MNGQVEETDIVEPEASKDEDMLEGSDQEELQKLRRI